MGNISSTYFVFDDDGLDTIDNIDNIDNIDKKLEEMEVKDLNNDAKKMNEHIGYCVKNKLFYETKIELLEDKIVALESSYDDLILDYSRIKIKYEALQKKIE